MLGVRSVGAVDLACCAVGHAGPDNQGFGDVESIVRVADAEVDEKTGLRGLSQFLPLALGPLHVAADAPSAILKSRQLENLALRHQLGVLRSRNVLAVTEALWRDSPVVSGSVVRQSAFVYWDLKEAVTSGPPYGD